MKKFVFWLGQRKSKVFRHPVTILAPQIFLKAFCEKGAVKEWNGRKACLVLSFDCDYAEDVQAIPEIVRLLASYSVKASFASIGKLIESYPREHELVIKGGHEILNHTYTHPNNEVLNPNQRFNELTIDEQRGEVDKCHKICQNILGYTPVGFRIPHFGALYTETIYGILQELGYRYSSSTMATRTPGFGAPFMKEGILEFPVSGCPQHPFGVFDTWHSLDRGGGKHRRKGQFYKLFCQLMDIGIETNSFTNVYFDPQDVAGLDDFSHLLAYIQNRQGDIWVATYREVADWWAQTRGGKN